MEGETEQWYLYWLRDQINASKDAAYKVAIEAKVEKEPTEVYKEAYNHRKDRNIPFV